MKLCAPTIISLALLISTPALANDYTEQDVRGVTYCYPVKDAVKTIKQLAKVKDEHRDIVDVKLTPRFLIYDEGRLPDRFYIADGDDMTDLTITSGGLVPDFTEKVTTSPKDARLCINDEARAGLPSEDESLYFEMGLTPYFNNTSGRHALEELSEGTQDGKIHYKRMIPAAIRVFMPDTNYFLVKYTAKDAKQKMFAETPDGLVPISGEYYNEGYVISLKQLDDAQASALVIQGGDYKLAPVPSIKTMKKFGVGRPRGPQKDNINTN